MLTRLRDFLKRSMSVIPKWFDVVALIVAISVFTAMVVPRLDTDSAYFDEGYSAYLANLSPADAAHYTAYDVHPPLYYVTLHYWQQIFGGDIATLRLLSVVFAAVGIVFAFLIVKRLFGKRAAITILPFVVFSPLFIRYSEAARMYTMALAICLAASYVLLHIWQSRPQPRNAYLWILYACLVAAGMWTNYFTALVWVSHALWIGFEQLRLRQNRQAAISWKAWVSAVTLAIIIYIPWIPQLLIRYQDVQETGFWIKPVSIDTLASTVTVSTSLQQASDVTGWMALATAVWVLVSLGLFLATYRQLHDANRQKMRFLLVLSSGPVLLLILMSMPPLRSAFVYRYALIGMFVGLIVIGVCLSLITFKKRSILKRSALSIFLIGLLVIGSMTALERGNRNLDTGIKSVVKEAVKTVDYHGAAGEAIIFYSPYTYYAATLYDSSTHPVYYKFTEELKGNATRALYDRPEQRGIKDMPTFLQSRDTVWLVGDDKGAVSTAPITSWTQIQSYELKDPQTGKASAYAVQYRAP